MFFTRSHTTIQTPADDDLDDDFEANDWIIGDSEPQVLDDETVPLSASETCFCMKNIAYLINYAILCKKTSSSECIERYNAKNKMLLMLQVILSKSFYRLFWEISSPGFPKTDNLLNATKKWYGSWHIQILLHNI